MNTIVVSIINQCYYWSYAVPNLAIKNQLYCKSHVLFMFSWFTPIKLYQDPMEVPIFAFEITVFSHGKLRCFANRHWRWRRTSFVRTTSSAFARGGRDCFAGCQKKHGVLTINKYLKTIWWNHYIYILLYVNIKCLMIFIYIDSLVVHPRNRKWVSSPQIF
jgi:hypothetical protein